MRRLADRTAGLIGPRTRLGSASRPLVGAYGRAFLASFVLLAVLWAALPDRRDWLSREGGPIEGLTVVLYASGAMIGLRARRRGGAPAGPAIVAGLCLLGALEELGYGDTLLPGIPLPVVLGVRVDSLHDLLEVGRVAAGRRPAASLLLAAAALASGALVVAAGGDRRVRTLGAREVDVRWGFVALAVALGLVAQALDVFRLSVYLEETLELEAALALAFAAAAQVGQASPRGAENEGGPPSRVGLR